MNLFTLSGLLTALTSIALGYFVYLKDPARKLNKLWMVFTVSVTLWGFGAMWIGLAKTPEEALWAWRMTFAFGVVWIPPFFHQFVCSFCEIRKRSSFIWVYIIGASFFPLIFTPLFFSDVRFAFSSFYYSVPGLIFPAFVVWWVGSIVYSHYELIKAYGRAPVNKKNQIKYFFLATAIGYTGGTTCYLPIFNINLYPVLNFTVPLYPMIMAYAIVKHQLMDIRTVIHKTAMWMVTSAALVIPTGAALYVMRPWTNQLAWWQFLLVVGGLLAVSIPYMRFVQPKIDHLFQRRVYDLRAVLEGFMHDVAIVKSIPDFGQKFVSTIRKVLYAEPTTLLLWSNKEHKYVVAGHAGELSIDGADPWLRWLKGQGRVVELSEVIAGTDLALADAARAYAAQTQAVLCLPLHHDGQLVGVANIGPRQNLKRFSQVERDFLETLRVEASIGLTNSLLYDEVKQLSEELEGKVEARTRELTVAMHQLKATESQLIQSEKLAAHGLLAAGVLHEINNPLSFSRGSLSVLKRALARVKEASRGAMDPLLAEVERAAEIIQNGHERIAAIVKDLKTFAKMDVQGIKPTDLHHNLDATVSLLRHELGDRITVEKSYGALGQIEVDPAQINQVFLNVLHNALQAITGYGVITIKTWREGDRVFIAVRDTGQGIEAQHLPRIFEPFFTTKPVGHGTGLGLSVSHRIISEHGGQILVTSEAGRGTEFVIELPAQQTVANAAA